MPVWDYLMGTTWSDYYWNSVSLTSTSDSSMLTPWNITITTGSSVTERVLTQNWEYLPPLYQGTTTQFPMPPDTSAIYRRERARRRAHRLLREHLSAAQRTQLEKAGYFELTSSSGDRYRVYRGYSRNVVRVDEEGRGLVRLCAHGPTELPEEDHMLMQKLMLESQETEFLRIANASAA